MKITAIRIHQPVGLFRVLTDTDLEGWCLGVREDTAPQIQSRYREVLLGRDALDREYLWQELVSRELAQGLPSSLRGPLDVALWDLAGKATGLPVYRLIGGFRDRVPAIKNGRPQPDVQAFVADAVQAQKEGFWGYKHRCGPGGADLRQVAPALRQAVGPDFRLMHDGAQGYSLSAALRVGRCLEEQDYFWFEEPLRDFDGSGLRQLSAALDIPIAAAEYLPGSLYATAQLLAPQAVDIVRAGVPMQGGITDLIKIARLAEAFGVSCEVSSVGIMDGFVHAHVLGAIKNGTFFEARHPGAQGGEPWIKNPLLLTDGYLPVPQSPGLGVELDWAEVEKQTERVV